MYHTIPRAMYKVESYQMRIEELPDCWKPISHNQSCRLCEMRKRLVILN